MNETNSHPVNRIDDEFGQDSRKKRTAAIAVTVLLVITALAVISAVLVKQFVVTSFVVDGVSMYPTLDGGAGAAMDGDPKNGDILYLNRVAKIKKGDIVVFRPGEEWFSEEPEKALVKRVIATGGDRLQIKDNTVYLNGEPLSEDYVKDGYIDYKGCLESETVIPDGCVFLMGDNRNNSDDCRLHGPVSLNTIVGKCFMIKTVGGKLIIP